LSEVSADVVQFVDNQSSCISLIQPYNQMERISQMNAQFTANAAAASTTKDSLSIVDNRTGKL
jgi:hypothetical protein